MDEEVLIPVALLYSHSRISVLAFILMDGLRDGRNDRRCESHLMAQTKNCFEFKTWHLFGVVNPENTETTLVPSALSNKSKL